MLKKKSKWKFEWTGKFANTKKYGGSDLVILRSFEDDDEDGEEEILGEIKPLLVRFDDNKKLEVVKVSKYDLDQVLAKIDDDTKFEFVFSQDRVKFVSNTRLVPADVDDFDTCVFFAPDPEED